GQLATPQPTWDDRFRVHLPHPQDGGAMRAYAEQYGYDAVGNILSVIHQAANGNWQREYGYRDASLVEPSAVGNRLSGTVVHPNADQPIVETYAHDAHGNMTAMPHLATMTWDVSDQLQSADLGGGGTAFYVYDAAGQRVRKVIAAQGGVRRKERISFGTFEVYREYDGAGGAVTLERETLHVLDGAQRVALVETRTVGSDAAPAAVIRYQFGNHLGSAALELDEAGAVISYEEYYPYGSTSYQAGRSAAEVSLKRYRYTGKERDEESGFTYHGARYYAPWLGRWTATDPDGLVNGPNLFAYVLDNPTNATDATGTQASPPPRPSADMTPEEAEEAFWAIAKDVPFPTAPERGGGGTQGADAASEVDLRRAYVQDQMAIWQGEHELWAEDMAFKDMMEAARTGAAAVVPDKWQYLAVPKPEPPPPHKPDIFTVKPPGVTIGETFSQLGYPGAGAFVDLGMAAAPFAKGAATFELPQFALEPPLRAANEPFASTPESAGRAANEAPPPLILPPGPLPPPNAPPIGRSATIRALRQAGTPEALATAKLITRGDINLQFAPTDPHGQGATGRADWAPSNRITLYQDQLTSPQRAAGAAAHESLHIIQSLTPTSYRLMWEFYAYQWTRAADPTFTMTDQQIKNYLLTHPVYSSYQW
ncbi:MAG TPA: RHS repeat-associated core domain-containing protein, partial [Vicinamibacterales bacterium]|nr:RHS repeat-associated core domain-containing protein [Vicinamibacterales bacterium]